MDIIIGAGITGLSYAKYTNNDYMIIEKNDHIGGYCNTIYRGDFIWDYSGHFFHFRNSELKDELYKNFNDNEILHLLKQTQIEYNGNKIDFPFQQNIHQLPKNEFIDCLYDFYYKEEKKYTSFKEMVYARFGKSICKKFLIPYNEKLYGCDLNDLDHNAMGRFFPYTNLDDIISNFKNQSKSSYNSEYTYPQKGAMQYINSIYRDIEKNKCLLNEELIKVDLKNKVATTTKREIAYDNLISTIPFDMLMQISSIDFDKNLYSWNKVLVFNFGFDSQSDDTYNHWIYFPNKEYTFYRVGFYSNILKQNRMSLYVEVGFSKNEKIDINIIRKKVLADLRKVKIINNQKLVDEHNVILDPAYVHINTKVELDKKNKMQMLNIENVYSIGRYGDWKYCSIEDNIIEAKDLAKKLQRK